MAKNHVKLTAPEVSSFNSALFRAGLEELQFENENIDKMLHIEIIERAQSEWALLIEFAPKNDGSQRFCINYRKLKFVTVKNAYPIQRKD